MVWVFISGILLSSCATEVLAPKPTQPQSRVTEKVSAPLSPAPELDPATQWAQAHLAQMSLQEKAGQFLIIGIPGTTLTPKLKEQLSLLKPGGIILFSRNIKSFNQLRKFTDELQNHALSEKRPPYLIMLDQEGGSVTRIKIGSPLPSALALSSTNSPDFVRSYSSTMGELLNRLGVNMNLAPVLDVSDPTTDSFIGSRSFGKSNETVMNLGIAFSRGQWDAGVIPTAKHFPGHGGLNQDSHKVTPIKHITLDELMMGEGKPFSAFSQLNFPTAIMLGHVSYPSIDASKYPAAFSHEIGQNLLRKRLMFTGLAITDDLEMSGAEIVGSVEQRTIQAIRAGNDLIMVAWSTPRQFKAHQALMNATQNGSLTEARVNESLLRILSTKYASYQKRMPYSPAAILNLKNRLAHLSREVKRLSFQSALGEQLGLTFSAFPKEPVQVVSSDFKFFKTFKSSFRAPSRHLHVTKSNIFQVVQNLNRHIPNNPFVFYVSGLGTARWINQLSAAAKMKAIIINTNQPGAIQSKEPFLKVVHINSQSPESGEWLAQYLNPLLRTPAANPL